MVLDLYSEINNKKKICTDKNHEGNLTLNNVKYCQKLIQGTPTFRNFRIHDPRHFVIQFQALIL